MNFRGSAFVAYLTLAVVLKSGEPVPYEGRLSRLQNLGSRSRDEWREWFDDLGKSNSVQQNLNVEVNTTDENNKIILT